MAGLPVGGANTASSARALAWLIVLASTAGCMSQAPHASDNYIPAAFLPTDCLAGLNGIDLNLATIADLQAALTDGRITSVQLVDAYLARIAAFDQAPSTGPLNAIRHLNPTARDQATALDAERAAGHVRGPLHGIPILLKDNINTFDEPTTAGSIALELNVPPKDATVTQRLRDAGMVILGKTNMVEFAGMMTGQAPGAYSSLGGQVLSAYTGGSPAGSSSGSGVAGSMAFAAVTIGTETSGSIMFPSNTNSLAGLKTTTGLVSRGGVIPLAASFDTVGPMGRNVADLAVVLDAMAGSDPRDARTSPADDHLVAGGYVSKLVPDALRGVRLGYDPNATAGDALFEQALKVLEGAGAVLVPFDTASRDLGGGDVVVDFNEFKFGINRYLANDAGPGIPVSDLTGIILYNQLHPEKIKGQERLIAADATPGDATLASFATLPQSTIVHTLYDDIFAQDNLDAIVDSGPYLVLSGDFVGYPSITVPMGYVGHDPHGLNLFGQAWSDDRLLAYAFAYEQATQARIPPTVLNTTLVEGICV